jgi:chlorinating enzyme
MTTLAVNNKARRLTGDEVEQYHERGYVKNLSVFDAEGAKALQEGFVSRIENVPKDVDIYRVNNWHKASRWFYDLAQTPAILDYVEDILGSDFFLWACAFFVKFPRDEIKTPWHQDAKYWPLEPRTTVTAWVAVFNSTPENGCMRVIPGSHRWGDLEHGDIADAPAWDADKETRAEKRASKYSLWQQVDPNAFDESDAVDIDLKAGEISLHDDDLLHSSGGNPTDGMRAGVTLRYCPIEVKADLEKWPTFEVYQARGVDRYGHNPIGTVPKGDSHPSSFNQASEEFE